MVLCVNIQRTKFTGHYYRYSLRYSQHRYCIQKHYTKPRFTGKRTPGSCNARQLSKGFRTYFISLHTRPPC